MKKNAPDPSPPPKLTPEERRFKGLLRKLVAVPISEIHEKRKEYRKRRRNKS